MSGDPRVPAKIQTERKGAFQKASRPARGLPPAGGGADDASQPYGLPLGDLGVLPTEWTAAPLGRVPSGGFPARVSTVPPSLPRQASTGLAFTTHQTPDGVWEACREAPSLTAQEREGKRRVGQGTEDAGQGIVDARCTPRSTILRVTLLAAGFVVGPSGASIHQIEQVCRVKILSHNLPKDEHCPRLTREFNIMGGGVDAQANAVAVVQCAVHVYKQLSEGPLQGVKVRRLHLVKGVLFRYEPPPRTKVPHAAQVEYDASELPLLKVPKRTPAVRDEIISMRRRLAQRDEALMRARLKPEGRRGGLDAQASFAVQLFLDPRDVVEPGEDTALPDGFAVPPAFQGNATAPGWFSPPQAATPKGGGGGDSPDWLQAPIHTEPWAFNRRQETSQTLSIKAEWATAKEFRPQQSGRGKSPLFGAAEPAHAGEAIVKESSSSSVSSFSSTSSLWTFGEQPATTPRARLEPGDYLPYHIEDPDCGHAPRSAGDGASSPGSLFSLDGLSSDGGPARGVADAPDHQASQIASMMSMCGLDAGDPSEAFSA